MTSDVALILGIDGLANGAVYLLAGLGPGADLLGHAGGVRAVRRRRRVRRARAWPRSRPAACRRRSGWSRRSPLLARGGRGRRAWCAAARPRASRAPCSAGACCRRCPCLLAWAVGGPRRAAARCRSSRAVAAGGADHAAGRARGAAADRRRVGAGAADRLAGAALPAVRASGLLFFGPEGSRTAPLAGGALTLRRGFPVSGQVMLMVGVGASC